MFGACHFAVAVGSTCTDTSLTCGDYGTCAKDGNGDDTCTCDRGAVINGAGTVCNGKITVKASYLNAAVIKLAQLLQFLPRWCSMSTVSKVCSMQQSC